jgi:hypothetical protein
MKWFWWIGGAVLYIALKNPNGRDPPGMWLLLLAVLVAASMLGQSSAAKQKKREQEERDHLAAQAAEQALAEYKQVESGKPVAPKP